MTQPSQGKRLPGKVVVISGAAQGQGAAHARACAREGAAVVLGDIDEERGQDVAGRLRADGCRVLFTRLDVSSPNDWARTVQAALAEFGRIDGLVNNAGIASGGDALSTTDEEWARTIAVNQTGPFLGIRHVAPAIRDSGGGSIVNVSSTLGFFASSAGYAYQATKGAIRMLTKSAALRLAGDGIRVNTVLPGLVETSFLAPFRAAGALDDSISRTPLGRPAQPEEISAGVVFLLGDEAAYVTGSELVIDGGMTAGSAASLRPAGAES